MQVAGFAGFCTRARAGAPTERPRPALQAPRFQDVVGRESVDGVAAFDVGRALPVLSTLDEDQLGYSASSDRP